MFYYFSDQCCQTIQSISSNTPRKTELRKTVKTLRDEVKKCRKKIETGITLDDVIKFLDDNYPAEFCTFFQAQLTLLNKSPKGSRYSDEFKKFALGLYLVGPNPYKKMSKICRLPSQSTLKRFIRHWVIKPGFNEFIFKLFELRTGILEEKAKDCVICIDEMSIKSHLYYDISKDKIIGFQEGLNTTSPYIASNVLVLMVRGIASSWKQPFGYFFYKTSPTSVELKDILFESIRRLSVVGLNVLGVVSDQGSNFYSLVRNLLKLSEENPVFKVDEKELVYIFDVPHLIKSMRNNFYAYKFIFNGKETSKVYLEKMYTSDKEKNYRLAPKLSNDHIFPNNFQKMKVKLATQVFSHSVAVALFTYIDFGILPKEATPTAEFIENINILFDLLNSNTLENYTAFMGTEKQVSFLHKMETIFKNLKVENHNGKNVTKQLKFIFGWRLSINATLILFKKLQTKNYKYLFTRNLNQDCLENFFGHIRNCCGHVKNPTPIQFCRAFKKMFTLRQLEQTEGTNCIEDINELLLNASPVIQQVNIFPPIPPVTCTSIKVFTNDYKNLKTPEGNSLVYVTGYFLRKCLLQHSCETCEEFSQLDNLDAEEKTFCHLKSYTETSGLTIPSRDIVEFVRALETIFISKFSELALEENVGKKIKQFLSHVTFNHPCTNFPLTYFVNLYIRVRIYFTLKFANQEIKTCRLSKINTKLSILQHL